MALGVICLGAVMIVIDTTIVNVALPAIQRDLGFSQDSLAWVLNAYLLTFGGLQLMAGRTADLLGRRATFMAGLSLFTAASLLCGLAQSPAMLVAARALQGVGGAILSSVALSLIVTLFPEERDRAKAMSVWTFVASAGGSLGVVAGGLLTQGLNWHWVFLVNLPVGLAALILCPLLVPASPRGAFDKRPDLAGAALITGFPMLAVFAIVQANSAGWASPITLGLLGASVGAAALFIAIEARVAAPLVPLSVFRSRNLAGGSGVMALMGGGFFGWFFFAALYLQRIAGYDPLQTGVAFLPATLVMGAFSAGLSARIVGAWGPRGPLLAGLGLMTTGLILLARAPIDGIFVRDVLPSMMLLGIGAGLCFLPLMLTAVSDVQPQDSGVASGLLTTAQLISGSIMLAILASVAAARTAGLAAASGSPTALLGGYQLAFVLAALCVLASLVLAAAVLKPVRSAA